jgi:hypothetical protein
MQCFSIAGVGLARAAAAAQCHPDGRATTPTTMMMSPTTMMIVNPMLLLLHLQRVKCLPHTAETSDVTSLPPRSQSLMMTSLIVIMALMLTMLLTLMSMKLP